MKQGKEETKRIAESSKAPKPPELIPERKMVKNQENPVLTKKEKAKSKTRRFASAFSARESLNNTKKKGNPKESQRNSSESPQILKERLKKSSISIVPSPKLSRGSSGLKPRSFDFLKNSSDLLGISRKSSQEGINHVSNENGSGLRLKKTQMNPRTNDPSAKGRDQLKKPNDNSKRSQTDPILNHSRQKQKGSSKSQKKPVSVEIQVKKTNLSPLRTKERVKSASSELKQQKTQNKSFLNHEKA